MLGLPPHLQKRLYFPFKPSLDSCGVRRNYTGVLTSLNKVEFRMDIPAVTREYTPDSCRNSRYPMAHTPRWEMILDFPALGAEESRVLNQTG